MCNCCVRIAAENDIAHTHTYSISRAATRSKHIKGLKERYFLGQRQSGNFRGNPLCQATKRHLNNRYMVKKRKEKRKDGKWDEKLDQKVPEIRTRSPQTSVARSSAVHRAGITARWDDRQRQITGRRWPCIIIAWSRGAWPGYEVCVR